MTRIAAIARRTSATALALCLALAFLPLGCGGTGGVGELPGPIHHEAEGPSLPDATIAKLQVCAEHGSDRLKEKEYAFQFAGVELAPVTLVAAGVTVFVGVTIYVSEKVIETVKRRRKSKNQCAEMFAECKSRNYPCNAKEVS